MLHFFLTRYFSGDAVKKSKTMFLKFRTQSRFDLASASRQCKSEFSQNLVLEVYRFPFWSGLLLRNSSVESVRVLPVLALNEIYIGESLSSRVSYLEVQVCPILYLVNHCFVQYPFHMVSEWHRWAEWTTYIRWISFFFASSTRILEHLWGPLTSLHFPRCGVEPVTIVCFTPIGNKHLPSRRIDPTSEVSS
jgi:hypothetical protein